jgi:hypothetical protein
MCQICKKKYDVNIKVIICYEFNNLYIPKTLINLEQLNCPFSNVKKIPKELINLEILECYNTNVKTIPNTLTNLKSLYCANTQIKFIPETIINLRRLHCDDDILVSPQTYKIEPNNKYYLTFTRCQKNYKNKLRLKNLKFAYHPKYIIGYTIKKQLINLFLKTEFKIY